MKIVFPLILALILVGVTSAVASAGHDGGGLAVGQHKNLLLKTICADAGVGNRGERFVNSTDECNELFSESDDRDADPANSGRHGTQLSVGLHKNLLLKTICSDAGNGNGAEHFTSSTDKCEKQPWADEDSSGDSDPANSGKSRGG